MLRMKTPSRAGFTLVEMTLAIVVMGIIAVSVLPVINGMTESYTGAVDLRREVDRSTYAMERVVRQLREVPKGATAGTVGLTTATATRCVFSDGRAIEWTGTTLYLTPPTSVGGGQKILATNVTDFAIEYRNQSDADTIGTPNATQRFVVRMVAGGVELRSVAFARVRAVAP